MMDIVGGDSVTDEYGVFLGRVDTGDALDRWGAIEPGPGAWTLIGRGLSLEFGSRAATTLGFARGCRLHLDAGQG